MSTLSVRGEVNIADSVKTEASQRDQVRELVRVHVEGESETERTLQISHFAIS